MIRLECPKCDKKLGVPDEQAGGVGVCPACKSKFRIPEAEPEEESPPVKKPVSKTRNENVTTSASKRRPPIEQDEDEEEDEKPVRKRKPVARDDDEDDEEDERPVRKRRPVARDDDDDEDEDDEEERRPSKKKKRKKKRRSSSGAGFSMGDNWYMMAALGVGGICLVCGIIGIFLPVLLLIPFIIGWGVSIAGSLWFLIVAFQDDIMQGILCLLVPCYSLYYLMVNFEEEKLPFFTYLLGFLIMMASGAAGSALQAAQMN